MAVQTAEQTVFPDVNPTPQASGVDFGAQVGAAQQNVGAAINYTADVETKHVLAFQGLKNEAMSQDADIAYQGDLGKLENQYYGLEGKAAADAYPKFQADILALRQQYLGRAPNPEMASMLGQSISYSTTRALLSAGRYAGEQTKSWMIQSADGRAQMLAYQAAQNWNDPNYKAAAFDAIDAAAQNVGDLKNWSPETTALYAQKWKDQAEKDSQANAWKFLQSQKPWDVISAIGGGPSGGAQPTVPGIDDVAATMRGKEGDTRGYQTPGGGAYQVHGGPVNEKSTPAEQDAFFKAEFPARMDQLSQKLGHQATLADGALAWQQGVGGATALLTHPDENAVSALVNAGVPEKTAVQSIEGNGGSRFQTASAFVAHVKDYYGLPDAVPANAGQTTLTPTQMAQANSPGQDSQIKAAFDALPLDKQQEMRKFLIDSWNTQAAAARAQTNFDQQQKAKADKEDFDNHVDMGKQAVEANWANPTQAPPLDLGKLAQDPWYAAHPDAITKIMEYRTALARPATNPNLSAQNTSALFARFFPPDGSPPTATQRDLDAAMGSTDPNQHINMDGYRFISEQLKARAKGGANWQTAMSATTKALERQIDPSFMDIGGSQTHSPYGGIRFAAFQQAVAAKAQALVNEGKDPMILFQKDPKNPDYIGNPGGLLSLYTRNQTDLMNETMEGAQETPPDFQAVAAPQPAEGQAPPIETPPIQPSVSNEPKEYKTKADLQAAIDNGELTRDQAIQYALNHKLGIRKAAGTGPAIPTGQ